MLSGERKTGSMPEEGGRGTKRAPWLTHALRSLLQKMEKALRKAGVRAPRGEYFLWSLFLGLSCVFLWSAFSGPDGAIELWKRRASLERLEAENEVLLIQNQALEKEVYLLRNSPAYLEKIAREEYGYTYEGEKVYTLRDPEPPAGRGGIEDEDGGKGALPP